MINFGRIMITTPMVANRNPRPIYRGLCAEHQWPMKNEEIPLDNNIPVTKDDTITLENPKWRSIVVTTEDVMPTTEPSTNPPIHKHMMKKNGVFNG